MKKTVDWPAVARARRKIAEITRAQPEKAGTANVDDWTEIMKRDGDLMAETQQTAFRLPTDLLRRLDNHVKRLQKATPGMNVTRADVVRIMLTKGLDDVEEKSPSRSSKSKG